MTLPGSDTTPSTLKVDSAPVGTPSSETLSNDTLSDGTLWSESPRVIPVSAEIQYTIDDFKCYIARQMAVDVLQFNIDEGDQRDDHPGM